MKPYVETRVGLMYLVKLHDTIGVGPNPILLMFL